jgi:iron complex outermembrane receptor protein
VFSYKEHIGSSFRNQLEVGTEIQESRSLAASNRFTGDIDTPNQAPSVVSGGGSLLRYKTNQTSFFGIDRFTYEPFDLTLVVGLSANTIRYERADLFADPGYIPANPAGVPYKDQSFEKNFETSVNPHIALQKLWKHQIFQVSYSHGYNAPTASSTYISGLTRANDSLLPEKARMIEFGVQGLVFNTHLDYQFSIFRMDVEDKLTQLGSTQVLPSGPVNYTYFANTGVQRNQGVELSVGYKWIPKANHIIAHIEPFVTSSLYDFTYTDFKTKLGPTVNDYSNKQVVGVPREKVTMGLDLLSPQGIYLNNTFQYMGDVYSDFANTNRVGGFTQYNAKVGYRHSFGFQRFAPKNFDVDVFFAGNNLSNQTNYTFLFLGNSINDADANSGYGPGVTTDVTPGPSQAYFFGGATLRYRF